MFTEFEPNRTEPKPRFEFHLHRVLLWIPVEPLLCAVSRRWTLLAGTSLKVVRRRAKTKQSAENQGNDYAEISAACTDVAAPHICNHVWPLWDTNIWALPYFFLITIIISLFRMAPIQRQKRRGLHRVHQVSLQQFRKSVLRQSMTCYGQHRANRSRVTRDAAAAKERTPKDVFILTTSSI